MKKTLKLINEFEQRNNISIAVLLCSDGSSTVEEFWENEELNNSDTIEELHEFLINTNYKLDEKGLCFSPVQLKNK
jgi:hypothetical protein